MPKQTPFPSAVKEPEIYQRALERFRQLADRYNDLVWYARSAPADSPFWDTMPADIRRNALNSQAKVEEKYPDEIDQLKCPGCGTWTHGYNSGVLAAARLMLAYLICPEPPDNPEDEITWDEQIEFAENDFPDLDT